MKKLSYNSGTVVIGPSIPGQNRIVTLFPGFDIHPFPIPTATTTIGIDVEKNAHRFEALRRIASERYNGDASAMLREFLAEGAGAADIALIARHLSDEVIVAQSLRRVLIDIEALREDDDRYSYLRFSNKPNSAVVFDAVAGAPERMLACLPVRRVDDMVDIVYPDGLRRRAPIARQALHLLIDALHVHDASFLDCIYVTAAKRDVVPASVCASIEVRILSAYDVSRTTGRVFGWNDATPDDFPIGLATDATVAVVRSDGSEVVDVPLAGHVVLPIHGDGDDDATFPAANIVASLLDVRFPQSKRFIVFSGDITERMVRSAQSAGDDRRDAARLVANMARAFCLGVAPMLVRTDEEDEWRQRRYLASNDVLVDFPAALSEVYGWRISGDVIGRLAQTIIRYRRSNVAVRLTSCAPFENEWLIRPVYDDDDDVSSIVIAPA
jgi:hypothetical protein